MLMLVRVTSCARALVPVLMHVCKLVLMLMHARAHVCSCLLGLGGLHIGLDVVLTRSVLLEGGHVGGVVMVCGGLLVMVVWWCRGGIEGLRDEGATGQKRSSAAVGVAAGSGWRNVTGLYCIAIKPTITN